MHIFSGVQLFLLLASALFVNGKFRFTSILFTKLMNGFEKTDEKCFNIAEAKYPMMEENWTNNDICLFSKVIVKSRNKGLPAHCKDFHKRMERIVKNKCKNTRLATLKYEPLSSEVFREKIWMFLHMRKTRQVLDKV